MGDEIGDVASIALAVEGVVLRAEENDHVLSVELVTESDPAVLHLVGADAGLEEEISARRNSGCVCACAYVRHSGRGDGTRGHVAEKKCLPPWLVGVSHVHRPRLTWFGISEG